VFVIDRRPILGREAVPQDVLARQELDLKRLVAGIDLDVLQIAHELPTHLGPSLVTVNNSEGVYLGQIAIYCRVSTDDQSCARQERDLRAFAKRAGHQIVGIFKETASGARNDRVERQKVMALARAREIDAILVTELSRWGRSTQDLVQTLDDLHSWKVSVLAQTGLSFDLSTASGKLMRTIMAGLAEFERDLIRERVKSGLEAARSRGVILGRRIGHRPSDKKAKKVLAMHRDGLSYRLIGRNVGLSKNTVMEIVRRSTTA
jgi:putative DNA-invertase from lambdoid prophage Rac